MIVVDTTLLVYAVGREHPLREHSRRLVASVRDGRLRASTTAEVIQEFVHVRARRHGRAEAAGLGLEWGRLFSPLLATDGHDLELGLSLYASLPLGAFDALLAAVALRGEADALVSADRSFAAVPGLMHVAPDTDAFERLLAV